MIRFDVVMEDIKFSLEAVDDGNYKLRATDESAEETAEKIVTSKEAAALLFASFDETDFESLGTVFDTAQKAMKGFAVQIIP